MAELDLQRAVDDVGYFAEAVLRRPLWDHQLEAAGSGRFVTCIAAARRTGKSTLLETLAAWTAFRFPGCKVVLLSAGEEASRRLIEGIGGVLAASPVTRGAVADDLRTRIRLSTGSEIVSLPASQRQVRGLGRGVKLLAIDEAGFVEDQLWAAARYIALDERGDGGRVLLTGTPWGGVDAFFRRHFEAGRDGDEEVASFHWTYKANPDLDHAYLERERDRVAPGEYAAEVLGEWSDAVGALFPRALLDRQTADLELPAFWGLDGPAMPAIGVDWGVSFDRSAAAALFRLPGLRDINDKYVPRFTVMVRVWEQAAPLADVVDEVAGWKAWPSIVTTEQNGVGAMPSQELMRQLVERRAGRRLRTNPIATSAASKTVGYGALLAALERDQLILPREPVLLRQLAGLRFEHGQRGFTRIEAESDVVHDDVADAAMLAAAPYQRKGQRGWRCGLLDAMDPRRAPADEDLPGEWAGETTTSGGGTVVWSRPPLQSFDGPGLSLPGDPGRMRPTTSRR